MTVHLNPVKDRVVVKRIHPLDVTSGGIHIPETSHRREGLAEGTVLKVGPGRVTRIGELIKPDVQVGDRVMFGEHAGTDIAIEDEAFLVLRADEVMGVV